MSGWKPEQSDLDEVGVYVFVGHRRVRHHRARTRKLLERRAGQDFAIFYSVRDCQFGFRAYFDPLWRRAGPNSATATACSASAHAIGDSFKIIERGAAEMMICGGTEATITPMGHWRIRFDEGAVTRNDDPSHASRPFDAQRDGFVVGEGAGILILESLEHAQKRDRANPGGNCGLRHVRRRISHHATGGKTAAARFA